MKTFIIMLICAGLLTTAAVAARLTDTIETAEHSSPAEIIKLGRLEIGRKDKEVFRSRDSTLVLYIDTLIMKDRSSLHFYGKKKVTLHIRHAEIGDRAYLTGISNANNASNFDITIKFGKLGSLYVMANGLDAMNGTRTDPNGDGGDVILRYLDTGIIPQQENRRKPHYLHVDASGGGRHINPTADIQRIYSQIINSRFGLRGLPRGLVYSGSMGRDGDVEVVMIASEDH